MSMTGSQLWPNEAELIKSVRNGEREAFYELVRPYERMIYATAISVVKNAADAEEVAQELPARELAVDAELLQVALVRRDRATDDRREDASMPLVLAGTGPPPPGLHVVPRLWFLLF